METTSLELYVTGLDGFAGWQPTKQIDYIAYYLLSVGGHSSVTATDISQHFTQLTLRPYKRLAAYLSEGTRKNGRYVKHDKGYRLERTAYDTIRMDVDSEPKRVQVSQQLKDLIPQIKDSQERSFLEEAIRCYRVEAYRATIVMVWSLTIDHLQKYIFGQKLNEFNAAIASHSDKKMRKITNYDDFGDLKEIRLIELSRSANVISNDVRKILEEKLGIRNSAGHPSGITFSGHKTTEFALDLIQNVLLKY